MNKAHPYGPPSKDPRWTKPPVLEPEPVEPEPAPEPEPELEPEPAPEPPTEAPPKKPNRKRGRPMTIIRDNIRNYTPAQIKGMIVRRSYEAMLIATDLLAGSLRGADKRQRFVSAEFIVRQLSNPDYLKGIQKIEDEVNKAEAKKDVAEKGVEWDKK